MTPSTTHVANASQFSIWAKVVDYEKKVIEGVEILLPGDVEIRTERAKNFAVEHGFTKISPRVTTPFYAGDRVAWVFKTEVYVSAFYVNNNGAILGICSAHPVPANHSVVIVKDMTLRCTKMIELWEDTAGNRH